MSSILLACGSVAGRGCDDPAAVAAVAVAPMTEGEQWSGAGEVISELQRCTKWCAKLKKDPGMARQNTEGTA